MAIKILYLVKIRHLLFLLTKFNKLVTKVKEIILEIRYLNSNQTSYKLHVFYVFSF